MHRDKFTFFSSIIYVSEQFFASIRKNRRREANASSRTASYKIITNKGQAWRRLSSHNLRQPPPPFFLDNLLLTSQPCAPVGRFGQIGATKSVFRGSNRKFQPLIGCHETWRHVVDLLCWIIIEQCFYWEWPVLPTSDDFLLLHFKTRITLPTRVLLYEVTVMPATPIYPPLSDLEFSLLYSRQLADIPKLIQPTSSNHISWTHILILLRFWMWLETMFGLVTGFITRNYK
jgi:hypothetical protein